MTKNQYGNFFKQKTNNDQIEKNIWVNPNISSFRLTLFGRNLFLDSVEFECHLVNIKISKWTARHVLAIDKTMTGPFWYKIDPKKQMLNMEFFDRSDQAVVLCLYNNLDMFLKHYKK